MADVGSQKCLHGNTPLCALGLYGSGLNTCIDLQYRGINMGKCLSKAVNLRKLFLVKSMSLNGSLHRVLAFLPAITAYYDNSIFPGDKNLALLPFASYYFR